MNTIKDLQGLSEKIYLCLNKPEEEENVSDHLRLSRALEELGYQSIRFSLDALRKIYPLCREAQWRVTVTLVPRKGECLVTDVENGDKTQEHYGLAVDYGSTTILMQAVDMETGQILAEANETNGQAAYGADILTRITYGLEGADRKKQLRLATVET